MTRKLVSALAVVACLTAFAAPASAQTGFTATATDIGPVVGLGGIGQASLSFGGRFEKAIRQTGEDLNNGVIGIQVAANYYAFDVIGYDYTYIQLGGTANYHFNLENDQVDPFLGLGLGYSIISCDATGFGGACAASALFFIGRVGIRYFFQDAMALYADAGAGGAAVNVGLMFKLGG